MTERATGPSHPYRGRPARSRWRSVADAGHPLAIADWYRKKFELSGLRVGTAGFDGDDDLFRQARELLGHAVPAREHRVLADFEDSSHGGVVWQGGRGIRNVVLV